MIELSARHWRRILLAVALLQLVSSALFLFTIRKPIGDEIFYAPDVALYEQQGVSVASLRDHSTVAGPMMAILASIGGRAVPGSVVARRVPIFATWLLAVALLLLLARERRDDAVVPIAGAFLLAFPHTPLSMATLLSEGPATACVLGAIWTSGLARRPLPETSSLGRALASGACVGLALCSRQYYLALVPAFALAWWLRPGRVARVIAFGVGPSLALLAYFLIWGGLVSARARAGSVVSHGLHQEVALNLARPLSALAYAGIYALPLLPWRRLERRSLLALAAVGFGLAALAFKAHVLSPGPLLNAAESVGRVRPVLGPFLGILTRWGISGVGLTAIGVLAWLCWSRRSRLRDPFAALAAAMLALFALEQLGVGGNIAFFERYAHQTVFFASALAVMLSPPGAAGPLGFIALMVAAGQWILWRNAL